MKRNNELVLHILTTLDRFDHPISLSLSYFTDFSELDQEGLDDHVDLVVAKGFIKLSGRNCYELTWEGHDFLGYSSDYSLWRGATQVAGHLSFDAFYVVLKDLMLWKARKVAEEFSQRESAKKSRVER